MLVAIAAQSQMTINPSQSSKYLNDSVKVCNRIYGGNVQHVSEAGAIVMTMGKNEQDEALLIVFPAMVRKGMSYDPQKKLTNHKVCVSGLITKYDGAPAIVISNEGQIKANF